MARKSARWARMLAMCAAFAFAPAASAQAAGLSVTDMEHGATAQGMAQSLAGGGVTISNVVYTGSPNSGGTFTGGGGSSGIGFDSGIVMGSGSVQTTPLHAGPCEKGVEGPNECDGNTTVNGTPGDADLDAASGTPTFDAAVLQFDFVPQASTVEFKYVFSSDEYNEFSNTSFNDTFAFFVNGKNCALVPGTNQPVGVNTINGGNPYGTNAQNPQYFRNNDLNYGGGSINTEMDGLTVVLTCKANVTAGQVNHMKLAIADASDQVLDSNVFIQAGSLVSGTTIGTSLSGGGKSGAKITVPTGTAVRDSATLGGAGSGSATGTVSYRVYSDSKCTQVFADAGTKPVSNGNVPDSDSVILNQAGSYYWVASYSGDSTHNASSSKCGDEVATAEPTQQPTTTAYTGDTSQGYHDTANLSAQLKNSSSGQPVAGKTIQFNLGSQSCSGTTNASGNASCSIVLNQQPGGYTVKATFAGDSQYQAGSDSKPFTISKEETTLKYNGDTLILKGGDAQMSGVLKEDGTAPIQGRTVTFSLGSGSSAQSCSGVTDSTGTARCTIHVNQPLGPGTVTAKFGGDTFYLPSSDSSPVFVFATATGGGGSFVIGDKVADPGNQVTFWGAQWWKLNPMTGAPAPAAFKGFAASTQSNPPKCGEKWTTRPGNSSDPPPTVPSYMAVIVSSSISKSGSTITGDVRRVVIVKTDPGYGPDPGHAGTGKVVAELCHS